MKLPEGYSVNTTLSSHNPGWAIILKGNADAERTNSVIDIKKSSAVKHQDALPKTID